MRTTFLILCILLISYNTDAQINDTINWRPDYKLRWKDFIAAPEANSNAAAASYCNIIFRNYTTDTFVNIKVYCYFNKTQSWSRHKTEALLLKHEQGHFDIAELFARKFRKIIAGYKNDYDSLKKDIVVLYNNINSERMKYDNLYDAETESSKNRKMQNIWNEKILNEIKQLKEFAK